MNPLHNSLIKPVVALLLSSHVGFAHCQDDQARHEVLVRAETILQEDGKPEAARYLAQTYTNIENPEVSIDALNLALRYYHDLGEHEAVKQLAEQAIEQVPTDERRDFERLSYAYGYLARYLVEQKSDYAQAKPYVDICMRGTLRELCDGYENTIVWDKKKAFVKRLNDHVAENALGHGFVFFVTILILTAFAVHLLRKQPDASATDSDTPANAN